MSKSAFGQPLGAAAALVVAFAGSTLAAEPQAGEKNSPTTEVALTPEERAERDGRKACKVAICAAFRNKKSDGGDIACDIVKSWRKEQLAKLVGKLKVTWPYEGVRCTSAIKLKRGDIVKAMTEPKLDMKLDSHSVACTVGREKEASTDIKFELSPTVTFENGKATKAQINWGKIEAPTLIKSALWTATAADNSVNILSTTVVDDINDFIAKKCDEVKDEWAAK